MFEEFEHDLKRRGLGAVKAATQGLLLGAAVMFGLASGGAGLLVTGAILAVSLGSALQYQLGDMDHNFRKRRLIHFYRDEIAAATGKDPSQVQAQDLQNVADRNPTLDQAMEQSRVRRNFDVGTGIAAVAVAAVAVLAVGAMLATPLAGLALAMVVTKLVTGFLAFHASRAAIDTVGERMMGLDHATVNDRVRELAHAKEKGQKISQERVMELYLAANPPLAAQVRGKYGDDFHRLDAGARFDAITTIGADYDLESKTRDINLGLMKPQELAFLVAGQASGVKRLEGPGPSVGERVRDAAQHVKEKAGQALAHAGQRVKEAADAAAQKIGFRKSEVQGVVPDDQAALQARVDAREAAAIAGSSGPGASGDMVAAETSPGFVDRYLQERAAQQAMSPVRG